MRRLDVPWVFYDPFDGKSYKSVKHSFGAACRRAGIVDIRFHELRHTFASHLVMGGVDLKMVQELLGHEKLIMTLRYSHLLPAHKVKAVYILYGTLAGGLSTNKATKQKLYSPFKKEVALKG